VRGEQVSNTTTYHQHLGASEDGGALELHCATYLKFATILSSMNLIIIGKSLLKLA
jgi:hypothetical protein